MEVAMTDLRNQLESARREYQDIHYPGDLGKLVPSAGVANSLATSRPDVFRFRTPHALLALAASVLLTASTLALLFKPAHFHRDQLASWHNFSDIRLSSLIDDVTPRQTPQLLTRIQKPIMSSGQFLLNVGKDIAHQADALFHTV